MNAYELVVAINPSTSQEERDAIDTEIKSLLGAKSIKDHDDMGLVQFSYEMFQRK
jgi:ribosomal protein S6